MSEEILINFTPQETRVAVMLQGVVQELHIERVASRGLVGNVYLGRIVRILPGMQSAFVDVGLERTAFLHVADIWQPRETVSERPIEKILHDGQSIVVQVVKDPMGTKGARLSTQISIAGRMLVYLPQEKHIGISQRIESEAEREVLREKIARLVPEDETGGFIVRTIAENASDEEFATDIAYLRKTWADIRDKARVAAPPSVLYQELSLGQRVLRDFVNPETTRIVIDSRENFQRLQVFAGEYTPAVRPLLDHYTGERPLFDLHSVEEEIQKALARRVDLKSGGYLIIDQTEAMTTIDVNTGGFVGVRNFDDTIFKTNLEATVTIARQLRLRNLGGIIIVDFIDMENEEHKKAVLEEFNKSLARDHTRFDGQRLYPAWPGRDDAQAHPRIAGARALPTLSDLWRSRRGQDGAHRRLRNPARVAARGAPVQCPRVPCAGRPGRRSTSSSMKSHRPLPCFPTSSKSPYRCSPSRAIRPSSTTSS